MKYIKFLKVSDFKDVLSQHSKDEISFSRAVELLNLKVSERLNLTGLDELKRCESTSDYKQGQQDIIDEIKSKVLKIENESKGVDVMFDIISMLKGLEPKEKPEKKDTD